MGAAPAWREERTGPYGVAVIANMFAIAAWRLPSDYDDLVTLANWHGMHRLSLVLHHLSSRIEIDRRLLLGSRFVHGLAPTHHGPLPEPVAQLCPRAAMLFMLVGAHEVEPGPDIETPEAFVRHFLEEGLPEWRAQIARYAEDPWSPYARHLDALAQQAGLPGFDVTIGQFMHEMRDHAETRDREMVAREIRRLVAESGLSQRTFAARLGTSPSRMSSYCTGQVTPSAALLLRIRRLARAVASPEA
ncbi:helix-turn-helix transcriptional regulator [Nocardioides sp. W3-2-3]|uniref:helix-turn-helix domain-containing protein n=1 Tax=Nocardioides convexus TaxID=2712224 RepID=UPI002418B935|nr:helix-turn-helix transcriptional regulator [Nocardioides convexus]NHA01072.1 helix-turn-helix transcriptional regulator [Nocardioides convexus]